jgi:putative addiction module CopG family antidote
VVKLDQITLSDEAARFAEAQIAAGRFRTMDESISAAMKALQEQAEREQEWLEEARAAVDRGRAAHARGEYVETTPDELMDGIERELGL